MPDDEYKDQSLELPRLASARRVMIWYNVFICGTLFFAGQVACDMAYAEGSGSRVDPQVAALTLSSVAYRLLLVGLALWGTKRVSEMPLALAALLMVAGAGLTALIVLPMFKERGVVWLLTLLFVLSELIVATLCFLGVREISRSRQAS